MYTFLKQLKWVSSKSFYCVIEIGTNNRELLLVLALTETLES